MNYLPGDGKRKKAVVQQPFDATVLSCGGFSEPPLLVSRKPLARRVVPKKTYVDHGEIKTPFAIIGVRSANCTNKQREVIQK